MAAAGWIVLVAGSGIGGCGGKADKSTPSAAPAAAGGKAGQSAPLAAEGVRQVISTATLRVEVKDVTAATERRVSWPGRPVVSLQAQRRPAAPTTGGRR